MKNIIKRGTSLLLVFAMLLSFAAVVGATDGETTTAEQILTLEVGEVPLKAGEKTYVPVYGRIKDGYQIACLNISVQCDSGITIDKIATGIPNGKTNNFGNEETDPGVLEGVKGSTTSGEVNGIFRLGWLPNLSPKTYLKGTYTRTDGSEIPYFWVVVTAAQDTAAGGYEIKLDKHPDTAKACVVVDSNGTETDGVIDNIKTDNGEAVVYPANAELPVVVLTKTTFDVPTMADWLDFSPNNMAGKYDLSEYLKIVDTDTDGTVKLFDVEMFSASNATGLKGVQFDTVKKQLIVNPRKVTDVTGNGTLTIDSATAGTHTVSNETVTFKIAKDEPTLWKASFADYQNSYRNTIDFYQGNKTCFTLDDNNTYYAEAPDYNGNVSARTASMYPTVFDQYGQVLSGKTATATVALFSDSEYRHEVTSTYADYVKVNGTNLEISRELPTDVYCRLTVGVNDSAAPGTQTVAEFLIKSTKPRATSAEIVLKDVKGNQYTDSQGKPLYIFTIPAPGQNPVQIKIDAKILDQNKHEMTGSDKPGFTASASFGTTAITSESTNGLSLSEDNTLTITSEALALLKSATGQTTITVTVSVTGTNVTATETITLTKAQSVATKLATENSGWNYGEIRAGASDNMPLPGIGETSETPFTFLHLSVLDQYDTEITEVTCEHFKLYRAVVDNNDPAGILYSSGTDKYVKSTEIGASNATFSANANGVKLEITNAWDATKNQLAVPDGYYIVEATYPNPNNEDQPLVARCVIKLTKAPVPTTATVTAARDITVPEKGASEESVNLTATVKDQYGDDVSGTVTLSMNGKINAVYKPNGSAIVAFENDQAAGVTTGAFNNVLVLKVSNQLAWYMVEKDMSGNVTSVVTEGELRLPVKVTVGEGEHAPTLDATAKVKVSREASALKKATVTIKDAKGAAVKTVTLTAANETINMITPKTETSYTIEFSGKDQYGDTLTDEFVSGATAEGSGKFSWWRPNQESSYRMTVDATTKGLYQFTTRNFKYKVNVKFAPMQFFSDDKGTTEYQISDMLDLTTERTYGELDSSSQPITTWPGFLAAMVDQGAKKVYIQKDGTTYKEVNGNNLRVVIKDETGKTVFDVLDKTITSLKANAGTYTVSIVYTDPANEQYEVCHGAFKIEPREVRIVLDTGAKIEKEYDGTKNLPDNAANKLELTGKVGNDDVDIETGNLVFESKDVNASVDSETNLVIGDVNIVAVTGASSLSGDDAGNYTASIAGLKGKITQKALDSVTVTYADKPWDNTDDATGTPTITYEGAIDNNQITINVADVKYAHSDSTKLNSDVGATVTGGTVTLGNDAVSKNYTLPSTITWQGGIVKATFKIVLGDNKRFTYGNEGDNLKVKTEQLYVGTKKIEEVNSALVTYFATNKPELRVMESNGTTAAKRNSRDYYNWTGSSAYQLKEPDTGAGANYTFELDKSYTLTVDQLWITVSGTGLTKTYDGGNDLGDLTNASFTIECKTNGDKPSNENYSVLPDKLKYDSADAGENKTIKAKTTGIGNEKEFSLKVTDANGQEIKLSEAERLNYSVTVSLTGTINKYTLRVMPKSMSDLVYGSCDTAIGDALKADGTGNLTRDVLPLGYAAPRFNGTMVLKNADGTQATKTNGHYDVGTYTVTQGDVTETTGNYTINFETRDWTINKALANSALGDLNDLQATRNKTNEITLTPNYPITSTPTIRVVDGSEWIDGTPTVEVTSDGKIKITLPVEDGKVEDTSKVKLELTIPESGNYNQTVKEFDVKIIDKLVQDKFEIVQGESGTYSYSQGGVQLTTSGKATDDTVVSWSITDGADYASIDSATGKVTFLKPCTVTIKATASETDDYAAASDTYTLTITKGQVIITASSATMTANDPLPGFSATASGLNPKDSVSEVFQTLTASVSTDGKTAGTFRVTPNAVFKTGVKDWNEYYELSFVQGTLTVNPAVSVIDTVLPTIIAGNGCANGYANCACESFYDLDASRWYHESVDWAYNLGLMNGTTKSTFGPNAAATRAQTWTMLARIAGQDTRRSSTWYEVGQKWAMNLGITDGTNPMGSLTREQLAAMLYRYVGSPAVNGTLTFTDSANVSSWATDAMVWAVQNGILDGVGGNRLNPKGTTTRAQAAAIFMRFSKLINK